MADVDISGSLDDPTFTALIEEISDMVHQGADPQRTAVDLNAYSRPVLYGVIDLLHLDVSPGAGKPSMIKAIMQDHYGENVTYQLRTAW